MQFSSVAEFCGLGAAVKPAVLLSEAGKAYSRRPATWLPTDRPTWRPNDLRRATDG